jgi:hypothetical protein
MGEIDHRYFCDMMCSSVIRRANVIGRTIRPENYAEIVPHLREETTEFRAPFSMWIVSPPPGPLYRFNVRRKMIGDQGLTVKRGSSVHISPTREPLRHSLEINVDYMDGPAIVSFKDDFVYDESGAMIAPEPIVIAAIGLYGFLNQHQEYTGRFEGSSSHKF